MKVWKKEMKRVDNKWFLTIKNYFKHYKLNNMVEEYIIDMQILEAAVEQIIYKTKPLF